MLEVFMWFILLSFLHGSPPWLHLLPPPSLGEAVN